MTKRPFIGSGYLNLDLRPLGIDAKRFVRVLYQYTPAWPYYDPAQGKEVTVKAGIDIALDTRPRRPVQPVDHEATKDLVWFSMDILLVRHVLTVGLYERICEAIDTFARDEDRSRRRAAGAPPPSDLH
ncbi:hypothetical protein [Reyranella sp.]|jgi:hypothetical protein|uniref:hypothetical protein n=1 Tax=Reyranella sp. TaxID=1929291 RepID=UPI002F9327FF